MLQYASADKSFPNKIKANGWTANKVDSCPKEAALGALFLDMGKRGHGDLDALPMFSKVEDFESFNKDSVDNFLMSLSLAIVVDLRKKYIKDAASPLSGPAQVVGIRLRGFPSWYHFVTVHLQIFLQKLCQDNVNSTALLDKTSTPSKAAAGGAAAAASDSDVEIRKIPKGTKGPKSRTAPLPVITEVVITPSLWVRMGCGLICSHTHQQATTRGRSVSPSPDPTKRRASSPALTTTGSSTRTRSASPPPAPAKKAKPANEVGSV